MDTPVIAVDTRSIPLVPTAFGPRCAGELLRATIPLAGAGAPRPPLPSSVGHSFDIGEARSGLGMQPNGGLGDRWWEMAIALADLSDAVRLPDLAPLMSPAS